MPAGIPLDGRGIRYGDQEQRGEGDFEDFQSVEFDFECEDGMSFMLEFISFYLLFRLFSLPSSLLPFLSSSTHSHIPSSSPS